MNTQLLKTYTALVAITIVGLIVIQQLGISYPVTVTNLNRTSEFIVTGEGKVDVLPDTSEINVGVLVEKASSSEQAKSLLDEKNNAIVEALQKAGVKKEDIRTDTYSLSPNYQDPTRSSVQTYTGSVSIHIQTKEKNKVGQLTTIAQQAGANQIYGVNFKVGDRSSYKEKARKLAVQDAKDQAKKLAKETGIKLGRIVNVSEYSQPEQPPYETFAKAEVATDLPTQPIPSLEPGKDTITTSVTLIYEVR